MLSSLASIILAVKGVYIYMVWSDISVDSRELLVLEASYGRSFLNALAFLKKSIKNIIQHMHRKIG
jgi:hypothetical protein